MVRKRPRKKLVSAAPREKPVAPDAPNRRWSMDYMRDTLSNGRPFRPLNLLDDGSREALCIEVELSLPAPRVVLILEEAAGERGYPAEVVLDYGPELVCQALDTWAAGHGVRLRFIGPGKPVENCFVQSFKRHAEPRPRLDAHWFGDLNDSSKPSAMTTTTTGPTRGVGDLTAAEFASTRFFSGFNTLSKLSCCRAWRRPHYACASAQSRKISITVEREPTPPMPL